MIDFNDPETRAQLLEAIAIPDEPPPTPDELKAEQVEMRRRYDELAATVLAKAARLEEAKAAGRVAEQERDRAERLYRTRWGPTYKDAYQAAQANLDRHDREIIAECKREHSDFKLALNGALSSMIAHTKRHGDLAGAMEGIQ